MPNQPPEVLIQFLTSITIGLFLVGFIVTIVLLYQKRKLVQEKEIAHVKAGFEKELLQTKLEIQETVLTYVSQEIHDNIGQVMLLVNINNSLLQSMEINSEASTIIKENKTLVTKAMEDIAELSRSLHSDRISDIGVFAAIRQELLILSQKGIFTVDIDNQLSETDTSFTKETHLVVFRMYQEIVKNIIRHAAASNIRLVIKKEDGIILFTIIDNGKGFDTNTIEAASGVGLRSLRSRIGLIGGRIAIESVLGKGTTVRIFIPVEKSSS